MKQLLFSLLFLPVFGFGQTSEPDTLFCVQVMSTMNPHLVKPEMVSILSDNALIEHTVINGADYYRIMFVYHDLIHAQIAHTSWLKQHKNAFICTRFEYQVQKMLPLFTFD
jgi:hypothetical protein